MYIIENEDGKFFAGYTATSRPKEPHPKWSKEQAVTFSKKQLDETVRDLRSLGYKDLFLHGITPLGKIK